VTGLTGAPANYATKVEPNLSMTTVAIATSGNFRWPPGAVFC